MVNKILASNHTMRHTSIAVSCAVGTECSHHVHVESPDLHIQVLGRERSAREHLHTAVRNLYSGSVHDLL